MISGNLSVLSWRIKKPSPRLLGYISYIIGVLASALAAFVVVSAQARQML